MAARHKNPTSPQRTALAPYNFVSLPDRVLAFPAEDNPFQVDQSLYHDSHLTGWVDVTLETRSPVYIRGPLTPEEHRQAEREEKDNKTPHLQKMRNKPDFFYTRDPNEPVIPGSSLRGMIRTLAEVLGHGKLAPVSDEPLVYRAVGDISSHGEAYRQQLMAEVPGEKNHFIPRFRGGYIQRMDDGRWGIQPAQEIGGTTYARISEMKIPQRLDRWGKCRNAYEIHIAAGPYDFQEVRGGFVRIKYAKVTLASPIAEGGLRPAVLAVSGKMESKRSEAVIYMPDENQPTIPIPDGSDENDLRDLVTAYRNQISPEQERLLGKDGVLQPDQPVFYLMEKDRLVFFGHTQMFRIPYPRSPQQMLPSIHNDDNRIDLAEGLFGRARGTGEAQAGRVFFSDAQLEPEQTNPWLPENPVVIPAILSGPKPTTFQHYLTQDRPDVERGKGLSTYNDSSSRTTLRGHKFYWHKGPVQRQDFAEKPVPDESKDTQHTKMKPVREGLTFRFRVHFENLRLPELGLLLWALQLPGQGDHFHKLGMGKPLGLGAVKLTPTLYLVDPGRRYTHLFGKQGWYTGKEKSDTAQAVHAEAIKGFEKLILRLTKQEGVAFAKLPRIQELLALLNWPGPDKRETRYMEIEHADPTAKRGKRNEYRDRPVLPDPLHVR
jgi:CRISPR-associated protein (TIGR03986 family)